ncbi:U-box domain-containing protein 35-like, partial [Trifolium pratense]
LGAGRVVAVAIENNKTSQQAGKWAIENLLPKDQSLFLIHVKQTTNGDVNEHAMDSESKELFDSFRVFCNRKNIRCQEILLQETDISKALIDCISTYAIELLVLGAASRCGLARFRTPDVPTTVSKAAPTFCNVYIISKGKVSSVRSATTPTPKPAVMIAPPTPSAAAMIAPPTPSRSHQFQQPHAMSTRSLERSNPQSTRNYPPRRTYPSY